MILLLMMMVVVANLGRVFVLAGFLKADLLDTEAAHQLTLTDSLAGRIEAGLNLRLNVLRELAARLPGERVAGMGTAADWLARQDGALRPLFPAGVRLDEGAAGPMPVTLEGDVQAGGAARMVLAVPVTGPHGAVVARLSGAVDLPAPDVLGLAVEGSSYRFTLVAPDLGRVVAASDPDHAAGALPPPRLETLSASAMAGGRGTVETTASDGSRTLIAMAPIAGTGWVLIAERSHSDALRVLSHLRQFILGNTFGVAVLAAGVWALLVSWMLRPLSSAAVHMRRMAAGEESLHPLPVHRHDEIGEMVKGFNSLVERLCENEERMAHMAHHDALTGLPNRALFEDRLEQALLRAERQGGAFALLFLDLDGFKPINDTHGHDVGDEVLRQVAMRLKEVVRREDTVARYGGDEFVIILSDMHDPAMSVAAVIAKLHEAMAPPVEAAGRALTLGVSVGAALYPGDGQDGPSLLSCADQAMYQLKRVRAAAPVS